MNIWLFLSVILSVAMICATSLFSQYLDFIYKQKKIEKEDINLKDWRL